MAGCQLNHRSGTMERSARGLPSPTHHALVSMPTAIMIVIVGIASGFCSSAPLGPINFWVTDSIMRHKELMIRWFIAGVIVADVGHAIGAVWGYMTLLRHKTWIEDLPIVGGLLLLTIGVQSLRSSWGDEPSPLKVKLGERAPAESPRRQLALGFLMCALNPAFLAFWVTVIGLLRERFGIVLSSTHFLLFLFSIGLGDILWFSFLIFLSKRGRDLATPKLLRIIRQGIALAFIAIGLSTLVLEVHL